MPDAQKLFRGRSRRERLYLPCGELPMTLFARFRVEGISPEYVLKKLHREEISVYNVSKPQKNILYFSVKRKEERKVFAILKDSCYNSRKVSPDGWAGVIRKGKARVPLIVCFALAMLILYLTEPLVLSVRVIGVDGARREKIESVLHANGVRVGCVWKGEASLVSELLKVDGVSRCSFIKKGYVLTVDIGVRLGDGVRPEKEALLSEADGIVESVVVYAGRAEVKVGAEVKIGDILVSPYDGEGREVLPSARVSLICEAEGGYEELLLLTEGKFLTMEPCGDGFRVTYRHIQTINFF
ncbi:MAG: sporulation protein YqfD [Christensenellaceae bacterium]